jgi:transcriptional regulator of heat shock response
MEELKPISEEEVAKQRNEVNMIFVDAAHASIANRDRWLAQFEAYKKIDDPLKSVAQSLCDIYYQLTIVAESSTKKFLTPEQFKQADRLARDMVLVTICTGSVDNPIEKIKKLFDGVEIDEWVNTARAKLAEKDAAKLNKDVQKGVESMEK